MLHAVFTQTLYFPFGEIIVFTLILPYLKEKKQAKKAGLLGIAISGIILAFNVALNISVLGVDLNMRSLPIAEYDPDDSSSRISGQA